MLRIAEIIRSLEVIYYTVVLFDSTHAIPSTKCYIYTVSDKDAA